MIHDGEPIEMRNLRRTLGVLADIDHPGNWGGAAFEDPRRLAMIERFVEDFVEHLVESYDHENEYRRGLAWLLNQDDKTLKDALSHGMGTYPYTTMAECRRFLELLWERTFADWRYVTDPHDPDVEDPEVIGLPD